MSKIHGKKLYTKSGNPLISSYFLGLQKVATEKSGFKDKEDVNIEYLANKIIVTKKEV